MQGTSPSPDSDKAEWRKWFRAILATIADPDEQSAAIRRRIGRHLEERPPCCISGYSALPGEPSILDLVATFPDHRWAFPRVVDSDLVFHQIDRPEQLRPGAFGIPEPEAGLPVVPVTDIDIFLCPGLGFDRRGVRLGRGKGFYDRSLALARPEALRMGIAFHQQIVDQLAADPHDIPMNLIIS